FGFPECRCGSGGQARMQRTVSRSNGIKMTRRDRASSFCDGKARLASIPSLEVACSPASTGSHDSKHLRNGAAMTLECPAYLSPCASMPQKMNLSMAQSSHPLTKRQNSSKRIGSVTPLLEREMSSKG